MNAAEFKGHILAFAGSGRDQQSESYTWLHSLFSTPARVTPLTPDGQQIAVLLGTSSSSAK